MYTFSHSLHHLTHICTAATQEWKILIWWNRHRDTHTYIYANILSQKRKKSEKSIEAIWTNAHTLPSIQNTYTTHMHRKRARYTYILFYLAIIFPCSFFGAMLYLLLYAMECFCVFAYTTHTWQGVFAFVFVCLFMLVNMLYNTMDANENNRHKKWHKRRKL